MAKCKICKQDEDWVYWLLRGRMCVHCYLELDRKLKPLEITEEQIKRWKISEKAVDKYYKQHFQQPHNKQNGKKQQD